MNSRGIVEVIVAMVGVQLGLLSPAMYTIIVLVAIITSLMAPPLPRFATARIDATAEETMRESIYGDATRHDKHGERRHARVTLAAVRAGSSQARQGFRCNRPSPICRE